MLTQTALSFGIAFGPLITRVDVYDGFWLVEEIKQ